MTAGDKNESRKLFISYDFSNIHGSQADKEKITLFFKFFFSKLILVQQNEIIEILLALLKDEKIYDETKKIANNILKKIILVFNRPQQEIALLNIIFTLLDIKRVTYASSIDESLEGFFTSLDLEKQKTIITHAITLLPDEDVSDEADGDRWLKRERQWLRATFLTKHVQNLTTLQQEELMTILFALWQNEKMDDIHHKLLEKLFLTLTPEQIENGVIIAFTVLQDKEKRAAKSIACQFLEIFFSKLNNTQQEEAITYVLDLLPDEARNVYKRTHYECYKTAVYEYLEKLIPHFNPAQKEQAVKGAVVLLQNKEGWRCGDTKKGCKFLEKLFSKLNGTQKKKVITAMLVVFQNNYSIWNDYYYSAKERIYIFLKALPNLTKVQQEKIITGGVDLLLQNEEVRKSKKAPELLKELIPRLNVEQRKKAMMVAFNVLESKDTDKMARACPFLKELAPALDNIQREKAITRGFTLLLLESAQRMSSSFCDLSDPSVQQQIAYELLTELLKIKEAHQEKKIEGGLVLLQDEKTSETKKIPALLKELIPQLNAVEREKEIIAMFTFLESKNTSEMASACMFLKEFVPHLNGIQAEKAMIGALTLLSLADEKIDSRDSWFFYREDTGYKKQKVAYELLKELSLHHKEQQAEIIARVFTLLQNKKAHYPTQMKACEFLKKVFQQLDPAQQEKLVKDVFVCLLENEKANDIVAETCTDESVYIWSEAQREKEQEKKMRDVLILYACEFLIECIPIPDEIQQERLIRNTLTLLKNSSHSHQTIQILEALFPKLNPAQQETVFISMLTYLQSEKCHSFMREKKVPEFLKEFFQSLPKEEKNRITKYLLNLCVLQPRHIRKDDDCDYNIALGSILLLNSLQQNNIQRETRFLRLSVITEKALYFCHKKVLHTALQSILDLTDNKLILLLDSSVENFLLVFQHNQEKVEIKMNSFPTLHPTLNLLFEILKQYSEKYGSFLFDYVAQYHLISFSHHPSLSPSDRKINAALPKCIQNTPQNNFTLTRTSSIPKKLSENKDEPQDRSAMNMLSSSPSSKRNTVRIIDRFQSRRRQLLSQLFSSTHHLFRRKNNSDPSSESKIRYGAEANANYARAMRDVDAIVIGQGSLRSTAIGARSRKGSVRVRAISQNASVEQMHAALQNYSIFAPKRRASRTQQATEKLSTSHSSTGKTGYPPVYATSASAPAARAGRDNIIISVTNIFSPK